MIAPSVPFFMYPVVIQTNDGLKIIITWSGISTDTHTGGYAASTYEVFYGVGTNSYKSLVNATSSTFTFTQTT